MFVTGQLAKVLANISVSAAQIDCLEVGLVHARSPQVRRQNEHDKMRHMQVIARECEKIYRILESIPCEVD